MKTTKRVAPPSRKAFRAKCLKSASEAYHYAVSIIGGRWPEAEKVISKDPLFAYNYVCYFIHERWPEGEKAIAKDPILAFEYARDIVKGKWPEGEESILKDPELAKEYAKALKRLLKAELKNRGWKKNHRGWNSPRGDFSENHRGLSLATAADFEDMADWL